MNVLKIGFFDSIMKLPCIFYELGHRNTEKCEKSNLGVLRQKPTKTTIVAYAKQLNNLDLPHECKNYE